MKISVVHEFKAIKMLPNSLASLNNHILFWTFMQLETFKRTLMQSLQEDDENPNVSVFRNPDCVLSLDVSKGMIFVSILLHQISECCKSWLF